MPNDFDTVKLFLFLQDSLVSRCVVCTSTLIQNSIKSHQELQNGFLLTDPPPHSLSVCQIVFDTEARKLELKC